MRMWARHLPWILGALLAFGSMVWGAGNSIPLQDAPPDLLARQQRDSDRSASLFAIGGVIFVLGARRAIRLSFKAPPAGKG